MKLKILLSAFVILLISSGQIHGQLIVAHRGSSYDAPENTLAAFRLAWEQNADAIEADFHLTADHQIVCIHDKTTERTCPGLPNQKVADLSLAELKKLDVGSWKSKKFAGEAIPTLAEVLSTVPEEKEIFVEIKCGIEIVPHLAVSLANSNLKSDQVVIICFNQEVVQAVRSELPQYKCNWLTSYNNDNAQQELRPSKQRVMKNLTELRATGIGSQFNLDVVDQSFVHELQMSGFEFHVWTVDDPAKIETAIDLNVDSITTNRPDYAFKIRKMAYPLGRVRGPRRPWGFAEARSPPSR